MGEETLNSSSSAIPIGITIVTAVCRHSLKEIHYLKSSYPGNHTAGSFMPLPWN